MPSAVDALRLILRTEPCVSAEKPSRDLVYVVQIGDRDPVRVSQSRADLFHDCLDYHSMAHLIAGPR